VAQQYSWLPLIHRDINFKACYLKEHIPTDTCNIVPKSCIEVVIVKLCLFLSSVDSPAFCSSEWPC